MAGFKLIVFDWDGTLMDSADRIVASVNGALVGMGEEPLAQATIREIIGLGLREAFEALFPGREHDFYTHFMAGYRHHFLDANETPMPLFNGVPETLQQLQDRYLLGIATGKSRRGLDRVLDETGLRHHFIATRCADETFSKPHPQMLEDIIDIAGVEAAETLVVGDTEYDMNMARNAGAAGVGVSYGVHSCERLKQCRALDCLDSIDHLPAWLTR